ncbi:MAG TPA: nucleoside hydrolase [Candidatus Limnocylindrales bacterium]
MNAPVGHGRPVILDCDPGHDDALAMLLALARPEIDLAAITTVAGNSTLDNTTRNALSVLTLVGRTDVPVASGAAAPLQRELITAPNVHGGSGLAGADLPAPAVDVASDDAAAFMAQLVRQSQVPITLVPTGPLTNVAQFQARFPDEFRRLESICLMGGSITEGNVSASAEFNIWVDPEAARAVFESGLPVTMIPLDVTHQALVSLTDADRMEAFGNRTGIVFADLLRFFALFHIERYGWQGAPIHDAVAVANVALPDMVERRAYRVDVETVSELTRGRTVVDLHGVSRRAPNAQVGIRIDQPRFVEVLLDAVAQFP